jgi:hypothetical protein
VCIYLCEPNADALSSCNAVAAVFPRTPETPCQHMHAASSSRRIRPPQGFESGRVTPDLLVIRFRSLSMAAASASLRLPSDLCDRAACIGLGSGRVLSRVTLRALSWKADLLIM